jgi:hypothetical protein
MPDPCPVPAEPAKPCRCHQSFAYITPTHQGHCCFVPATQTCHQSEVVEWERQRDLRQPRSRDA